MFPLLQNKFIRFSLIGISVLVVIFIALIFLTTVNTSRSINYGISDDMMADPSAPTLSSNSIDAGVMMPAEEDMGRASSLHYPDPTPDIFTSGLESYETTEYSVSGHTKKFDDFCDTLTILKENPSIHFKYLSESTNSCHAILYAEETEVEKILSSLSSFSGVEIIRNTESVTKHKQQIQSQTAIIQEQLTSVSRSLSLAETQFDELAIFARQANDAVALSEAIRYKLQNIDTLTERKIYLNDQLNNLYQQATDLEERIDVVEFSVNISRSNPIVIGKYERQWERAYQDLRDTFTDTLIGLSAFLGIFVLWTLRLVIYGIVLIVVGRLLWKLIKFLWNK